MNSEPKTVIGRNYDYKACRQSVLHQNKFLAGQEFVDLVLHPREEKTFFACFRTKLDFLEIDDPEDEKKAMKEGEALGFDTNYSVTKFRIDENGALRILRFKNLETTEKAKEISNILFFLNADKNSLLLSIQNSQTFILDLDTFEEKESFKPFRDHFTLASFRDFSVDKKSTQENYQILNVKEASKSYNVDKNLKEKIEGAEGVVLSTHYEEEGGEVTSFVLAIKERGSKGELVRYSLSPQGTQVFSILAQFELQNRQLRGLLYCHLVYLSPTKFVFASEDRTQHFLIQIVDGEVSLEDLPGEGILLQKSGIYVSKVKEKKVFQVYTSGQEVEEEPFEFSNEFIRHRFDEHNSWLTKDFLLQVENSSKEVDLLLKEKKTGKLLSEAPLSFCPKLERVDGFIVLSQFPQIIEVYHIMLPNYSIKVKLPPNQRVYSICFNRKDSEPFKNQLLRFIVEESPTEEEEPSLSLYELQLSPAEVLSGKLLRPPQHLAAEEEEEYKTEEEIRSRKFKKVIDKPRYSEVSDEGDVYIASDTQIVYFDSPIVQAELLFPQIREKRSFYYLFSESKPQRVQIDKDKASLSTIDASTLPYSFSSYEQQAIKPSLINQAFEIKTQEGKTDYRFQEKFRKLEKKELSQGQANISQNGLQITLNGRQELLAGSAEAAARLSEKQAFFGQEQEVLTPTCGDSLLVIAPNHLGPRFLQIRRPVMGFNLLLQRDQDTPGKILHSTLGLQTACLFKLEDKEVILIFFQQCGYNMKRTAGLYDTNLNLLAPLDLTQPSSLQSRGQFFSDSLSSYFFQVQKYKAIRKFKLNKNEEGEYCFEFVSEAKLTEEVKDVIVTEQGVQVRTKQRTLFFTQDLAQSTSSQKKQILFTSLDTSYYIEEEKKIIKMKDKQQELVFQSQLKIEEIKNFVKDKESFLIAFFEGNQVGLIEEKGKKGINFFSFGGRIIVGAPNHVYISDGKILIDPFSGAKLVQYFGLDFEFGKNVFLSADRRILMSNLSIQQTHQPFQEIHKDSYLKEKIKNQLPLHQDPFGSAFFPREIGANVLKDIVFEKEFFNSFVSYFFDHATPEAYGILNLLFKESGASDEDLFHEAVVRDKLLANSLLEMLIAGQKANNFQSYVFRNVDDFKKVLGLSNSFNFLESCIQEIKSSSHLIQAAWKPEQDQVLISSSNFEVPENFRKHFDSNWGLTDEEKDQEQPTQNVQVFILELDFLGANSSIIGVFKLLADVEDDKLFSNKAIDAIVNKSWELVYPKILKYVFTPYLVFASCFLGYLIFFFELETKRINEKEELIYEARPTFFAWPLLLVSIFYSIFQLFFEGRQILEEGREYFGSSKFIWNFLDLTSSGAVLFFSIVVLTRSDIGSYFLIVGSLASFLIWIKLFYYLRIFRPTSSFIRMIVEMIKDIRVFLLIFFIGVFAFANFYYIIDKGNSDKLIKFQDSSYIGAVIYTYMQSLGELGYDDFEASNFASLIWSVFFVCTVLMTITLLNLLIAIMGDTYDRVQEVAKEAQLKENCAFIDEYSFLFPVDEFEKAPYIIIVRPESAEQGGGNEWEGKIGALKASFNKTMKIQDDKAVKQRKQIEDKITTLKQEIAEVTKNQKEVKEEMTKNQAEILAKLKGRQEAKNSDGEEESKDRQTKPIDQEGLVEELKQQLQRQEKLLDEQEKKFERILAQQKQEGKETVAQLVTSHKQEQLQLIQQQKEELRKRDEAQVLRDQEQRKRDDEQNMKLEEIMRMLKGEV